MSFGTPLAILLAVLFIIPGLLLKKMLQAFTPYSSTTSKITLTESLMVSCINYCVGIIPILILIRYWPQELDIRNPQSIPQHSLYLLGWASIVFILPVILGALFALLLKMDKFKNFLGRLGISILHPAPTAWDYAFARDATYWARIQLQDETIIEGLFGSDSLASSEKDQQDVFLQTVFVYNEEEKEYRILEQNAGVWISQNQIKTISFFNIEPGSNSSINTKTEE